MAASKTPVMLTREQIAAADDRPERVVEVPEWGGAIRIKALSLRAWQDAMDEATNGNGKIDERKASVLTLMGAIVEPQLEAADIELLRSKSTTVVGRLMGEIASLSGIDEETLKEAEATFPEAA